MEKTSEAESRLKARPLPRHVGIIMDGNGRWAEGRGLPRIEGHRVGSESVREITRFARRIGLEALTLYAFSSQNWSRPPEEVAALMDLLREFLLKEREEILTNGIRLNAIGQLDKLPKYVGEPLQALREESASNTGLTLTLALSYGGREELVNMARRLAGRVHSGQLAPSDVSEEVVEALMWTSGLPPVDLVIRTSGEQRLSNFMLWQSAYAELIFTEVLWPDFRGPQLADCLAGFQQRERRFGMTGAQVQTGSPDRVGS